MKEFWNEFWEIIGDGCIITLGVLTLYVFIVIEIFGRYGYEPNRYIRWIELIIGIPVIILGIKLFRKDLKNLRRRK